jgi:hypothetical protein
MDGTFYLNVGNYRLYDKDFGKARGRRLYCNTPTTDNAVQNLYRKAYSDTGTASPGLSVEAQEGV